MSKKQEKQTKKLFPKTIYVENYGTKKHPNISAMSSLDEVYMDYTHGTVETKPTVLARYELVEIGTLESTIKFKVSE